MQSYEDRLNMAKELTKQQHIENRPNQKFPRGARVKVSDNMPSYMSHFPKGFEAIVEYTYGQKFPQFDKNDIDNYCLIVLDENGKPVNSIAWYHESQLTLINNNINEGLKIIESYI